MSTTVRTAVRTYLLFGRSPAYFQHLCEKNGFEPAKNSSLMRRKYNRYEDYIACHVTARDNRPINDYIANLPIDDPFRVKAVLLTPVHDYIETLDDFENVYREYDPDIDPYYDDYSWWDLYARIRNAQIVKKPGRDKKDEGLWTDYDYDDVFFK